jgi:anti-sigma-K factor RskA
VEHCEPEQLALAALGEPLSAAEAAHVDACAQCRDEIASLKRGVDILAVPAFATSGPAIAPPPRVWDAIAAATGVQASPAGRAHAEMADAPAEPAIAAVPPAPATDSVVRQLRPRRSRALLAVAAAAVVVAAAAGAIALNRDDEVTLASTTLSTLDTGRPEGTASVVEEDDGTRVLRIELRTPPPQEGYYEAWLADASAKGMVSMGSVRPGTTSLPVPDDLNLTQWPTVEISVEPLNGDPAHSGVSLVRGSLDS